jgi:parallel beta-helix repeat protein
VSGRRDVTVRNVRLRDYYHGLYAHQSHRLTLVNNQITSTAEVPPNTVFLDIWRPAEEAYGGAVLLWEVTDSHVADNDLQHQMCGLLTYHCQRLTVRANQADYNSGFGFHLCGTCDSVFEDNYADYCCRYEPRGERCGHVGADAAGFLAVQGSCRNVFRRNFARLGGDGFFLAGLTPDGVSAGCDDNLFEENDASLSPNIAFEATFCRGNVFRRNYADRGNYGFWLGFSREHTLEDNRMLLNRQAGIAVENGCGFTVRGNHFQGNGHGILLWSRYVPEWIEAFPENVTSHDWTIEGNTFTRNGIGIGIAADRDHGIRPLPSDQCGRPETRPHDHTIRRNDIQDNRLGLELVNADRTLIEENLLSRNVEAHLSLRDARNTTVRNNPGAAGGGI